MSIVVTILALSFVIFIHELGHLLAAKRGGIGVYEFAIGMGPKVFGIKIGETEYTLRLLPIGGFVKLAGMDDSDANATQFSAERSINSASMKDRFLTISAGSLANVVLGFVIFVIIYSVLGVSQPTTDIQSFSNQSPAKAAGLEIGDTIRNINSTPVSTGEDVIRALQKTDRKESVTIGYERQGARSTVTVVPIQANDRQVIGVLFKNSATPKRVDPLTAVQLGTRATLENIVMTFTSIKLLVTGEVKADQMTGIVGIVQIASYGLQQGISNFLGFMAMISISLGIFNLLPLPALDGGHLLLLAIEKLRGRPLNPAWEARISNIGFALLIGLMVIILFNDIRQWTSRNRLMQSIDAKK